MPPLRQPPAMSALAEKQLVDMVVEAGEGLVATPGDPMHAAVLTKLHVAVRQLPEEAASRLSQAVLAAVDTALVYNELERTTSEVFAAISGWVTGTQPVDALKDLASLAAMTTPVNKDVARALLVVAKACVRENFTKVDTTELSAASTTAVVAHLPKGGVESLRLTSSVGCSLSPGVMYPLARALHDMPRLSVVVLGQSASDNLLRVLAQSCADTLEELDVAASRAVTDKGVAALGACSKLRDLKLTATSVSGAGAERALRDLPRLQRLGYIPDMGRAIAAAAREEDGSHGGRGAGHGGSQEGQDGRREELELRAYKSDRPPPLDVLAEHCPRLDEIAISLREDGDHYRMPTLAALRDAAPCLKRLSLICHEDGVANDLVGELVDWPEEPDDDGSVAKGQLADGGVRLAAETPATAPSPPPSLPPPVDSLTVLKLYWTPLAPWDVWVIGTTLPRLEELGLTSTPPSANSRSLRGPPPDQRLPENAFLKLKLFSGVDLLPEAELMVLSRGIALEEVYLCHWQTGSQRMSVSEDALLGALRDNPLEQLRDFSVDSAPFLGERAVQHLLRCPQLKALSFLSTWGQLASGRAEELQAEAERTNLDLTIL